MGVSEVSVQLMELALLVWKPPQRVAGFSTYRSSSTAMPHGEGFISTFLFIYSVRIQNGDTHIWLCYLVSSTNLNPGLYDSQWELILLQHLTKITPACLLLMKKSETQRTVTGWFWSSLWAHSALQTYLCASFPLFCVSVTIRRH